MPNGYTAALYEGDQSMRDYLMGVGRSLGFAILQRDEPSSEPVREVAMGSYETKRLAETEREAAAARAATPEQAAERGALAIAERRRSNAEQAAKKAAIARRYDDMLGQLSEWDGVPGLPSVKKYAVQYLTESKDFDCNIYDWPVLEERSPAEWRQHFIDEADKQLARVQDSFQDERRRTDERNQAISAFLASLPPAEAQEGTQA